MFLEGEVCVLNKHAIKGLPNRIGERCIIVENNYKSLNYDYLVQFDDMEIAPVKEVELNKLTETDKKHMEYIFTGNSVIHNPSGERVKILKVDYLLGQAEVEFSNDHSTIVVRFNNLTEMEIDSVRESLKVTHEDLIDIFINHYKNPDGTYTVPKELLINLLEYVFED